MDKSTLAHAAILGIRFGFVCCSKMRGLILFINRTEEQPTSPPISKLMKSSVAQSEVYSCTAMEKI
jgi:hypothetical protein